MWGLSWGDVKALADIGGWLALAVWGLFMWKLRSTFVTHRRLTQYAEEHEKVHQELQDRLDAGEKDFQEIRGSLARLSDQVQGVQINIAEVKGEVRRLDTKIDGHHAVSESNAKLLATIHEFLLNNRVGS